MSVPYGLGEDSEGCVVGSAAVHERGFISRRWSGAGVWGEGGIPGDDEVSSVMGARHRDTGAREGVGGVGALIAVLFVASATACINADSPVEPNIDKGSDRVNYGVPYLVDLAMVPPPERSVKALLRHRAVASA
jgi:hypothetical protein